MREYYDQRAREYDDFYEGRGRFAGRQRPGWEEELRELERTLAGLAPVRTLDVACGTGYLTRHLPGTVTGVDQSDRMLAVAAERVPGAAFARGDALALPFLDSSFDRVFTAHFYGHLDEKQRGAFLAEAGRVAPELVVVDSALRPGQPELEPAQERVLNDGSRWTVYKRYFSGGGLARELGGGTVLHDGDWFVAVVRTG